MFNIHITIERWKYSEQYGVWVSTIGRVKDKQKKFLELYPDRYMMVKVKDGTLKKVHRIMMETFNPIDDMLNFSVDHIDGNNKNNNISNLRWMTHEENHELGVKKNLVVLNNSLTLVLKDAPEIPEGQIGFKRKGSERWIVLPFEEAIKVVHKVSNCQKEAIRKTLKGFIEKKYDGKVKYGFIFKFF